MVVLVINEFGVFARERESQPPVLVDPNGEMPFQAALQRMEAPPGMIPITRPGGGVQLTQLQPEIGCPDRTADANSSLTAFSADSTLNRCFSVLEETFVGTRACRSNNRANGRAASAAVVVM